MESTLGQPLGEYSLTHAEKMSQQSPPSSLHLTDDVVDVRGPFKCYVTQWGWVGVSFPEKKHYEGVRFNVISVARGGSGSNFQGKSVTLHLSSPLVRSAISTFVTPCS